jgi:hypothetical protein
MARAAAIIALRALGLSLGQVARVLDGDAQALAAALADHEARLLGRHRQLAAVLENVRATRASLACGHATALDEVQRLLAPAASKPVIAFALPWPWGGEQFELTEVRSLNYIVGPLGSGKTRFAQRLAETLPHAAFLGLDRLASQKSQGCFGVDATLQSRVDRTLDWLVEHGATVSNALIALLVRLESENPVIPVVDMIEQGLEHNTQLALSAYLRHHWPSRGRPIFLMTRSSAILDLNSTGADEAIILCPANHSPPMLVSPYPGARGYEAVATCLASPAVRARTEGMIAWRPN